MENKFNSIVLSKTEPDTGSLWMRQVEDKGGPLGFSLWWFTTQGWKKLFDFDTRYDVTTNYSYSASESPYYSESDYNPEVGVSTVENTYYLYDSSRPIGNNSNLVVERGLKYHVDALQKQIDNLDTRLTKAESDIESLKSSVNSISSSLNSIRQSLNNLETRIGQLEQ